MGVIKQFNYVQGANQLYVEDFANISNSANNALAGLPWTTPLSICNAYFSGSGSSKVLNITPDTLVVVNGIVFGSDITVKMTSSQYLYAICEYDTSSPRQDGESEQYYQAVVRKIKVSDSPLSDTDLSNASVFPGIGNYPILSPNFSDSTGSIQVNSNGSISPFKSVIPDGGVTTIKIADNAITTQKIADNSVKGSNVQDGTISMVKLRGGAFVRPLNSYLLSATDTAIFAYTLSNDSVYLVNVGSRVLGLNLTIPEVGVTVFYVKNNRSDSVLVNVSFGSVQAAALGNVPANKTYKFTAHMCGQSKFAIDSVEVANLYHLG